MTDKINVIETGKKALQELRPEPIELEKGLEKIEVEGGKIILEICKADKIEKVVFSSIEVRTMSVSEESVIIWPKDGYNFPMLWCNLTTMPGMNMVIFDFIPLMDIVVWQEYGETYLKNLQEIKKKSLETLQGTIMEKDFDLSSVVVWSLSPYKLILKLTDEGVLSLTSVLSDYYSNYLSFWQKAQPVKNDEDLKFCRGKKEAIRKLMKENDPGYPIMVNIFGEEKTKKVFDIVF